MNILALDPATKTGWALSLSGTITAGVWTLATPKEIATQAKARFDRRCDVRFSRLYSRLLDVHRSSPLDWAVFEDVQWGSTVVQSHLWATWRAAIWMLGREGVKIECLPVATLKKFATGHGGATKDQMASALVRSDPRFLLEKGLVKDTVSGIYLTDDAVDAIHLLKWAIKTLKA